MNLFFHENSFADNVAHISYILQAGTDFLTREYSSKEARIPDLKVFQVM